MGEDLVPPHLGVSAHDLRNSRVLFLKSRQITDSDCAAISPLLKQNKALNQLFIGYNDFGDEGARHLCEALAAIEGGALELVGFRHCRLGDGAAQAVAELIKSSKTIVEVGVDENDISDSGAETLAAALPQSTSLQHLYIGKNKITKSGEGALQSAAPSPMKVYFNR